MDYVYSLTNNIKYFYNNMNSATLSGAIDVIVVEQPDGELHSTPFHIRFGKYSVFNSDEKYVDILINGNEVADLKMKLAENGVAYFMHESEEADVPAILASTTEKPSKKNALMKEAAVEAELLAGTDDHSVHPRTAIGKEVKAQQENGMKNAVDEPDLSDPLSGSEDNQDHPTSPLSGPEDNQDYPTSPVSGSEDNHYPPMSPISPEFKTRVESGSYTSDGSDEEPVLMERTRRIRSLRLSSDSLKSLKLQYGSNEARFTITTKFQGTSWCMCHIYLFKYSEKLVISDIDGTITKSDVLGHVIPAIGGQWAHTGVAELYTRIKENGYRIVYLSSRAIGQSHYTKNYLASLAQGSRRLPDGPVLLNPTSVLMAFRKEVIERKPEEFKIACLSDLKSLFPVKHPFYAGFGNRDTDIKSYAAVDVPPERILIINPSGAVRRADHIGFVSLYASMAVDTVDYLFPPLHSSRRRSSNDSSNASKHEKMVTNFTKPETCSAFTHWRTAPEDVISIDDDLANYENKRKVMEQQNKKTGKKKK